MDFTRCYSCMQELDRPGGRCPRCGNENNTLARSQPSHALPCGYLLHGRYVIGKTLGQGGFGMSSTMSTTVTWSGGNNGEELKRGRESFIKEARKAVKLRDLNSVVKVWDVFYENETAYLVMDYVEGVTLKHHLMETRKPLSEEECMHLLVPVMKDLEEVHARGIIHRDISPDNLMLRPDGMLVLLDIGAAKDLSRGNGQSSMLVAKKGFSPMEQYTTGGSIGPWTDVYAMCATMVYCVAGNLLPEPIDRLAGTEVDLRAFSPAFAEVLNRGLVIRPKERIQTMGELEAELGLAINPETTAGRERQREQERREEEPRREAERLEQEHLKRKAQEKAENGVKEREEQAEKVEKAAADGSRKKLKLPLILSVVAVLLLTVVGVIKIAGDSAAIVLVTSAPTAIKIVTTSQPTMELTEEELETTIPLATPLTPAPEPAVTPKSTESAEEMYALGEQYYHGNGVAQDYDRAFKYFEQAANAGSAEAMTYIGVMYALGRGVKQDYSKAMKWYTRAADAGSASAMNYIGLNYEDGKGVKQDYDKAMEWFVRAADAGNTYAMNNIAMLYYKGNGVKRDYSKAIEWYTRAAKLGNAVAMYMIGFMYERGEGVKQDYSKAMEWYTRAAELGDATSMYMIGSLYSLGWGINQDYTKALEWYTRAADAGEALAMHAIGAMYEYGHGVEQDQSKAQEWYDKARTAGYNG